MKYVFITLLTCILAAPAWAGETAIDAKKLHDSKCMSCHNTDVYSRTDHRVKSLEALSHQVKNCMKGPADANWTEAETAAVVEYLNSKFYKF